MSGDGAPGRKRSLGAPATQARALSVAFPGTERIHFFWSTGLSR